MEEKEYSKELRIIIWDGTTMKKESQFFRQHYEYFCRQVAPNAAYWKEKWNKRKYRIPYYVFIILWAVSKY